MFKKAIAIPLVLVSGLALTACTTNNTVPKKNETPMENLERNVTPRVNHGAGTNMDGIDNGRNGVHDGNGGIINDTNRNRMNGNNGTNGTTEEIIIDENRTGPNGEKIIIEENNRNRNGINTNNR